MILCGILLVSLSSLATYLIVKSQLKNQILTGSSTPVVKISPTPSITDETANWITYDNTKYGFSINHPRDTKIYILSYNTPYYTADYETIRFMIKGVLESANRPEEYQNLKEGVRMDLVIINAEGKSASESLSRHVDVSKFKDKIAIEKIAGLEAQSVKFQFPDWVQYTEIVKEGKLYEFSILTRGDYQEANLGLANQILSTFKFLD